MDRWLQIDFETISLLQTFNKMKKLFMCRKWCNASNNDFYHKTNFDTRNILVILLIVVSWLDMAS